MDLLSAFHEHAALIALAVLALMLFAFVQERMPPSAVASAAAAFFVACGLVKPDEALGVFSNSAAITVAAMLIISAALARTGILEAVITYLVGLARTRPATAILTLLLLTMFASAFINSTPVVVMLVPVMNSLAASTGIARRKLLIPLSYFAILGGTCTLIGTSTNLLVDNIARQQGLAGFGIFGITPIGLALALGGILFLFLTHRFLLPGKRDGDAEAVSEEKPDIITELRLPEDFAEIGKPYAKARLLAPRGVELVSVHRAGERLDPSDEETLIAARDRVVLRLSQEELATLQARADLGMGLRARTLPAGSKEEMAKVTIATGHRAVGQKIMDADFLSLQPVRVVGVSRRNNLAGPDLSSLILRDGDQLWVTGSREALAALRQDMKLITSDRPLAKPFRRNRALLVALTLSAVVGLATAGVMPIAALALIAVGFLFLVHAIDPSDAWRAIDGDVLALIFGMLIVGLGLQNSGAVNLIIDTVLPVLQHASPFLCVLIVYGLTTILTEMVTNNAVGVIVTPIAISLAHSLNIPPEAMVLAVMFGASASFATPIGYQTNTIVASAGNYRFTDFLRIGAPMNLIACLITTGMIYLIYLA